MPERGRFWLSCRDVEELMAERGVDVDHSTINRWVVKLSPQLLQGGYRHRAPVGASWRMDEAYVYARAAGAPRPGCRLFTLGVTPAAVTLPGL